MWSERGGKRALLKLLLTQVTSQVAVGTASAAPESSTRIIHPVTKRMKSTLTATSPGVGWGPVPRGAEIYYLKCPDFNKKLLSMQEIGTHTRTLE